MNLLLTPCRPLLAGVIALVLWGCSASSPTSAISLAAPPPEPDEQIADYLAVRCDAIWQATKPATLENALYWMRAIDCAQRLTPAEARAEAHRWPASRWADAFRRAILLENGDVTPVERRAYSETLDSLSARAPASVLPLLNLWRSRQALHLELSAARMRYQHLQQHSDSQLAQLRHERQQLQQQLATTRRQLERLTDIERQLSSRKSADVTDHAVESSPTTDDNDAHKEP